MSGDPGPVGSANIGAACAIFDGGGRVLLVKHTYGRLNWELPGGLALPGEAPWTTAQRELVVDELPTPFSDFSELRIRDALASDVSHRLIDARRWRP